MRKSKLNRNSWSDAENQTLVTIVDSEKNKSKGLKKAAIKLGRSYSACTYHYYKALKNTNSSTKMTSSMDFRFREIRITNDCITFIR